MLIKKLENSDTAWREQKMREEAENERSVLLAWREFYYSILWKILHIQCQAVPLGALCLVADFASVLFRGSLLAADCIHSATKLLTSACFAFVHPFICVDYWHFGRWSLWEVF
jgi:hypothetical protein